MTITQTVEIPADHRLTIDVPREVPVGRAQVIIQFPVMSPDQRADTAGVEHVHTHPCPICAAHLDPVTGNPRYNAETVAAIEEEGEISKCFNSFEDMWEDLMRDDPDD